jgi:hypothetical protein
MALSNALQACVCALGITGLFLMTVVIAATTTKPSGVGMIHATNTQIVFNWILWGLDFLRCSFVLYACLITCKTMFDLNWYHIRKDYFKHALACMFVLSTISATESLVFPKTSMRAFWFGSYIRAPQVSPVVFYVFSVFLGLFVVIVRALCCLKRFIVFQKKM